MLIEKRITAAFYCRVAADGPCIDRSRGCESAGGVESSDTSRCWAMLGEFGGIIAVVKQKNSAEKNKHDTADGKAIRIRPLVSSNTLLIVDSIAHGGT